jgi:NhaA family Na+:H+ antiporter
LKVFLTALAIADDIGAVLVIALFYTEKVRLGALVAAAVFLAVIVVANRRRVRRPGVYALLAVGVWVAVFVSGIHATVAGILVALMVPVRARIEPQKFFEAAEENLEALRSTRLTKESMIANADQLEALRGMYYAAADMRPPGLILEQSFHRTQAFFILPLFALFNAGVALDAESSAALLEPISLGIILGLFVGKQLGVTLFGWLAIKSGRAAMPEGVTWSQLWGVSCLAGVGFTMALFIGELAFLDPSMIAEAKIGILAASLVSGIVGFVILQKALPP